MANLIGDLFYSDNPQRREEINKLQTDSLDIQSDTVSHINAYNKAARLANDLTSYNVILRALVETSKNPFTEEELRKPVDLTTRPYNEAMVSSILDLAVRIGGGTAAGMVFGSAIKAFLNRPIAVAAENLGIELVSMGASRALIGAEGLAPGIAEGLAAGAEAGVAEVAGVAARGAKFTRAVSVLKVSGAAVALAVGVEVILGVIEGSRERDVLEQNLKKLREQKANLVKDRDGLAAARADAEKLIKLALEQFNRLQNELAEVTHIPPEVFTYSSQNDAENAVNAQRKWCTAGGNYIQSVQFFHRKWAELFAQDKEPTAEERSRVFADLITYGVLPSTEEGERRYRVMRRIDMAMKTPVRAA